MVESRWAIASRVASNRSIDDWISRSLSVSRLLVASSRISIRDWPAWLWRSPVSVAGRRESHASFADERVETRRDLVDELDGVAVGGRPHILLVAPRRPKAMLSRIVPSRNTSCSTIPIRLRYCSSVSSRRSTPSSSMEPPVGSKKRAMRFERVVLLARGADEGDQLARLCRQIDVVKHILIALRIGET